MTLPPDFRVLTGALRFPEGPIACDDGGVIVVEIEGKALTRVAPDGALRVLAELDGGPNGAAIGPDGAAYVCNSGGWLYTTTNGYRRPYAQAEVNGWIERVDLATGTASRLHTACGDVPLRAPNDIVFDRYGGYYFTDHGKRGTRALDITAVYYAPPNDAPLMAVATGMVTPNGVGLSPDGGTLYVAETLPRRVWAFTLRAPGEIAPEPWPSPNGGRLVAGLSDANLLDSMAIDAEGHICVASFNHCGIWRISPDGAAREFTPLDDYYATNIAFGGPDLRTAFVTLSSTGRLVAFTWPCPGLALAFAPHTEGIAA